MARSYGGACRCYKDDDLLKNRLRAGVERVICRYSQPVIIKSSRGGEYDKKSMKYVTKGRDEREENIAIFKKGSEVGSLKATIHGEDGKEISYDVKFFSRVPLKYTEDKGDQSDVIVWQGREYIIVYLDHMGFCNDLWTGYARSYKCTGAE